MHAQLQKGPVVVKSVVFLSLKVILNKNCIATELIHPLRQAANRLSLDGHSEITFEFKFLKSYRALQILQ
jgi:hypothetical protein